MGILYRIFPVSSAVTRRIGPKEAIHSPSSTSLVTNSQSSPASSRLGLTSAASVCNLLLHAEVSLHGTSVAMLKSCKVHACAGVCSDRVSSPAHARFHHIRAQTDHLSFLHGHVPSSCWSNTPVSNVCKQCKCASRNGVLSRVANNRQQVMLARMQTAHYLLHTFRGQHVGVQSNKVPRAEAWQATCSLQHTICALLDI